MGKRRTNVYIDNATYKKFKILCINRDESISSLINKLIKKEVESNEENI